MRCCSYLLILCSLLGLTLFPPMAGAQPFCHLLTSGDPVPPGFGAAYNLFSSQGELLVNVKCGPSSDATLAVGNGQDTLYIYRTAYEWTGSDWRELSLSGERRAGDWYIGSAATKLIRSETQLLDDNHVATYICHRVDSRWKCGCRDTACTQNYWQLQTFNGSSMDQPPSEDEDTPTDDNVAIWNNPNGVPHGGMMYGNPLGGYTTANTNKVAHMASLRFRAEKTGKLTKLRWHNRTLDQATINSRCSSSSDIWCKCKNNHLDHYLCGYITGNMYSVGNGGLTELTIQTDDGTSKHEPSGTIIGGIVVPSNQQGSFGNPNAFVPVLTPGYVTFDLDRSVAVKAGQIYHIVMRNLRPPTACPKAGGYSVSAAKKCDRDRGSQGLNGINGGPAPELVSGPFYGQTILIKSSAGASWKPYTGKTVAAWYVVTYDDGDAFGNGVTFHSSHTHLGYIGGSRKVRQRFTVEHADRTVNGFWLRVGRDGGTGMGNLTGTLTGGGLNLSASVPAASVSQGTNFSNDRIEWVYFTFPQNVKLREGTEYMLTFSAGPSGNYYVNAGFPFNQMNSKNDWNKAVAEKSSGGSWTTVRTDSWGKEADLSLAFTIAGKLKSVQF